MAACLLPWFGAESLSLESIMHFLQGENTVEGFIFFHQRIPRVIMALLVGGSLAMAGVALQVLFRNPLAEPWTLGVAGGASVGAFIAVVAPSIHFSIGPLATSQCLALVGALLVLGMVYLLARSPKSFASHTLLLAGITIGILSGGIIMLISYFISPYEFLSFHRWMVGGVDAVGYSDLGSFLILGIPGWILLASQTREFNHLALGSEMALGQGVDVRRTRNLAILGAGLITAAAVSVTGPIGFIGMLIPHATRALVGVDHRAVMPSAFAMGGIALACCDTFARTILAPTELPVGIITAVVGAPIFLLLLIRISR
ncbi:MAG: iron ABC transporter permease [Kiritimatiellae bacterium]|nr:iron ABC transporter permease [Kiritimatiellia bacterium]